MVCQRFPAFLAVLALFGSAGCAAAAAPASQVPHARAAIDRVHATQDCGLGIHAQAKIDRFARGGRIRTDLLLFALWPERLRMDILGPMNSGTVATLTTDEGKFSLLDLREKRFYVGSTSACNIARLTHVPVPGHVLVSLLRGDVPVLKHDEGASSVVWSTRGYYVIKIAGANDTEEEIHIAPFANDFGKPWQQQRMRVIEVEVLQQGVVLYRAELSDEKQAEMSKPRIDPDGIDPPEMPSGPFCAASLPRKIHVEVPSRDEDVLFRYDDQVTWNPPIPQGLFFQSIPNGVGLYSLLKCDAEPVHFETQPR
ncbi:MAG: hypothetical protein FWD73_00275 [Polyangiaceae bacterium]|nr:hypothetical protein [Polyangiaceae bacterium]